MRLTRFWVSLLTALTLVVPFSDTADAVELSAAAQTSRTDKAVVTPLPDDLHTMVFYGLGSYAKREFLPAFDEATFTWSRLDEDGRLVFDRSEYRWPAEGAEQLLEDVGREGVDRSLMVFSVNEHGELDKLLADPALQAEFALDLSEHMQAHGFTAAVLDFETLGAPDDDLEAVRESYTRLVARVADVLHSRGQKLTVVVAPLNGWHQGYDYPALAEHADLLYLMAYSYIADKKPQPLREIDEAIRLALDEVEADKVMLGINAFSETPETVQDKIGLAKQYDLQGIGFWILRVFDRPFLQAVDDRLVMRPERERLKAAFLAAMHGPPLPASLQMSREK